MQYRSVTDRNISAYAAVLIIALFAAGATLLIVHAASQTILTNDNENAVLSTLTGNA